MAKITVRPGDGRLVRMPGGRIVPAAGMQVEEDATIRKWLRIGDLVKVADAGEQEPAKAPAGKAGRSNAPTEEGLK